MSRDDIVDLLPRHPMGEQPLRWERPPASRNIMLRRGRYLCPRAEISTEQADKFSTPLSGVGFFAAHRPL